MTAIQDLVVFTHEDCLLHDTGPSHAERPERLRVILDMLGSELSQLPVMTGSPASDKDVLMAHPQAYLDYLRAQKPAEGRINLDSDTVMSPATLEAAFLSLGCALASIDAVMGGSARTAFSAARPPGHHAEYDRAMGFCLFGNAFIAARHAQEKYGVKRVAIVDFDVHHGNGTEDLVRKHGRDDILYISSHQHPLYPGTGLPGGDDFGGLVLNLPLPAGTTGADMRDAYEMQVFPKLESFNADLLILSAGFDTHKDDPLAQMMLVEDDFGWLTAKLMDFAPKTVSLLEGGYNLAALENSVLVHLQAMLEKIATKG